MSLCKAPDKLYSVKQMELSFTEGALMRSIYVLLFMINCLFVQLVYFDYYQEDHRSGAWVTGKNGGRMEGGGGIWV